MCKPNILVSVNPTYLCFNNCEYCYLGSLRNEIDVLSISKLNNLLKLVSDKYNISHIDIYGGDLSTLCKKYLSKLFECIYGFCTDITAISDPFADLVELKTKFKFNIATSVNAERPYSADLVQSDMLIYTVLPSMISIDANYFLRFQTKDISFNQYYDAKLADQHYRLSNKQYADFLIQILSAYNPTFNKFKIQNIYDLENAYQKRTNVFADSHVFIAPNGRFAQVKYSDAEEFEYFNDINYLDKIKKAEEIKFRYGNCATCKYNMQCIAEHLHYWDISDECCGMKSVLDWYIINRQKFMPYYGKPDTI